MIDLFCRSGFLYASTKRYLYNSKKDPEATVICTWPLKYQQISKFKFCSDLTMVGTLHSIIHRQYVNFVGV